jgi:hypothetical protein
MNEHVDFINQDQNDPDYTIYEKFINDSTLKGQLGKFGSYVIIDILKAFEKYKIQYNSEFCAICGKKLSLEEKDSISIHAFHVTCYEYRDKESFFILK